VGTTQPADYTDVGAGYNTLEVQGSGGGILAASKDAGTRGMMIFDDNGLAFDIVGDPANYKAIRWKAGEITSPTDNHMYLDSEGKLGIGTASPTTRLQVEGPVLVSGGGADAVTDGNKIQLVGKLGSPNSGDIRFGDGSGWRLHFARASDYGATKYLTIQDNGRVGIGTSSPQKKLHIVDDGDGEIQLEGQSTKLIMIDTNENDAGKIMLTTGTDKGLSFFVDADADKNPEYEAVYIKHDGRVKLKSLEGGESNVCVDADGYLVRC